MEIDPYEAAHVQYDDWHGSIAGDETDLANWENFLGIDSTKWRLLFISIYFGGGNQWLEPYVIEAQLTRNDLDELVKSGQPIRLIHLDGIEYQYPGHSDFNPPAPANLPVISATEFLIHAFKRLEIKLVFKSIPEHAKFQVVELSELENLD